MRNENVLFEDIAELLTLQSAEQKNARHVSESDLSIIKDAAMVCQQGRITWVGRKQDLKPLNFAHATISLQQRCVLPGFVECHTHSVFAGNRSHEFEWRQQGQTYQQISAQGGGILSTVKATRAADEAHLLELAQARLVRFVEQGVTTVEVKSGYGLDEETEIKILRVNRQLRGPRVISTYLGPHSRSPDHKSLADYMDVIINKVLPRVQQEKLADRADIYIEQGFYDLELGRRYFAAVKSLGLPIAAHVEQLSDMKGAMLALEFQPQSLDHLVFLNDGDIQAVAKSETTAVLLPTSDLYLRTAYPSARKLIDAGARVALSTDFNPGTSPTQDLSLVGLLARLEMKMSLPEVIVAYTLGAAHALGLSREVGALSLGKSADFSVLDGGWTDLFYSAGSLSVDEVYRAGQILYKKNKKSFDFFK